MEIESNPLPDAPVDLPTWLYGAVKTIFERQSEINRRVASIEKSVDAKRADSTRVDELEAWREESTDTRRDWRTWLLQTVGTVVITALVMWGLSRLGVPVTQ